MPSKRDESRQAANEGETTRAELFYFATVLLGIIGGVIAGAAAGVVLGVLLMPGRNPRQPLENEGYIFMQAIYFLWSAIAGGALGLMIGLFASRGAFWSALIGLLIGVVIGAFAWKNGVTFPVMMGEANAGCTLIVIAFGTAMISGLLGGIWSLVRRVYAR